MNELNDLEVTRIDFRFTEKIDGVIVRKYHEIPNVGRAVVVDHDEKDHAFDLEKALTWLREHGWDVITWDVGARAWKGERRPVRTAAEILRMRRQFNKYGAGAMQNVTAAGLNLVFYL